MIPSIHFVIARAICEITDCLKRSWYRYDRKGAKKSVSLISVVWTFKIHGIISFGEHFVLSYNQTLETKKISS